MAKKAKSAGTATSRGKRRAKAVVKPTEPKVTLTPREQRPAAAQAAKPVAKAAAKPAASRPLQTVDPEKMDAWRSLPEKQRNALREREAARMFQLAAGQHRTGDLAEAVKNYGKSLLLNPRQPDVYNNMGVALRALGKREAAVACYRRALALKPNNAGLYSNMGNALRELGRLEVAQASHQQAVRLNPRSTEAYYNLGLVLRDLGQTGAAMSCFDKALTLDPSHVDCQWDRALTLDPSHVDCQWDRALTLLEDGKLKEGFAA